MRVVYMPRVLIVDDSAAVRGILCDLLSENFDCDTAGSAEVAFQCFEAETYDVILTDVALPDASGIDLMKQVRLRDSETPVIMISGTLDEEQIQAAMQSGAFAYVKKPFDLDEIEQVVKRAFAKTCEAREEAFQNTR